MTPELFGPVVEEIKKRAEKAESAPEFLKSLFENRKEYKTAPLADVLHQCMLLGNLAGRAEVMGEGEEDDPQAREAMTAADGEISFFNMPFDEAVDYLKGLAPMTPKEYYKLNQMARSKAFTISGQASKDLLAGVKDSLTRALQEGQTYGSWRNGINSVFDHYGVTRLDSDRADLIFRQNTQTAYQVGRYQQMTHPAIMAVRPYWVYEAVHDGRTRPAHRAMDGLTFPVGHEFWKTHYPPNGFRCRCRVRALSIRQVQKRGLEVRDKMPDELPDPRTGELIDSFAPDPGFDMNPALAWAA